MVFAAAHGGVHVHFPKRDATGIDGEGDLELGAGPVDRRRRRPRPRPDSESGKKGGKEQKRRDFHGLSEALNNLVCL